MENKGRTSGSSQTIQYQKGKKEDISRLHEENHKLPQRKKNGEKTLLKEREKIQMNETGWGRVRLI